MGFNVSLYLHQGEAQMYGEYECNLPERTLNHLLKALNEVNPDLILYTGRL